MFKMYKRILRLAAVASVTAAAIVTNPEQVQGQTACQQACINQLNQCIAWGHPTNLCVGTYMICFGLCGGGNEE